VRVVWVHPSWRDLVIEHLIADTSARERFLRRCGINGAVLALSIAGGTTGERRLPLLVTDEDWDVLADRVYELAPDLEEAEQSALVDALSAAVEELEGSTTESEIRAFAQTVLSRISRLWGAAHAAVPLHLLEAWLALARDLAPSPDPAGLVATWAELLPADAPAPDDRDGVRHLVDWLTLVGLLRDNTPEVLAELGFPDRTRHVLNSFRGRGRPCGRRENGGGCRGRPVDVASLLGAR
jgi:hypothetical protein